MIGSSKVFQKRYSSKAFGVFFYFFLERAGLKIILTSDNITASVDIEEGSDNLQARKKCCLCILSLTHYGVIFKS